MLFCQGCSYYIIHMSQGKVANHIWENSSSPSSEWLGFVNPGNSILSVAFALRHTEDWRGIPFFSLKQDCTYPMVLLRQNSSLILISLLSAIHSTGNPLRLASFLFFTLTWYSSAPNPENEMKVFSKWNKPVNL